MDWVRIIEILITSITSIIVALVSAGFFRRMTEKQKSVESKNQLMEQIKKDEIVHLAIRDIRRRYNADRVYLWQLLSSTSNTRSSSTSTFNQKMPGFNLWHYCKYPT